MKSKNTLLVVEEEPPGDEELARVNEYILKITDTEQGAESILKLLSDRINNIAQ